MTSNSMTAEGSSGSDPGGGPQQDSIWTRGHVPGEAGVWIFILGDMCVFALFFLTFMYYRDANIAMYTASQANLSLNWGAINTLLLLASSWFVVLGLNAMRKQFMPLARRCYSAALACGLLFVLVKFFEWGAKIQAGHTLTENEFYMFYYVFTGVHLLHVLIGIGVLSYLIVLCGRGQTAADGEAFFEGGSAFWHMVDLLWIMLFPMLYLLK